MFENIVVRHIKAGDDVISPGKLAEVLLFYDNVHLLLEHGSLVGLLNSIGPDRLNSLLENGFLTASYLKQSFGTYTDNSGGLTKCNFTTYHFGGNKDGKKLKKDADVVSAIFELSLGKSRKTRNYAKKFLSNAPVKNVSSGFGHVGGIIGLANDDLNKSDYVKAAVKAVLEELIPGIALGDGWHFRIISCDGYFVIDTNLNFEELRKQAKLRSRKEIDITPAFLVGHVLEARANIALASDYMSEYVSDDISSKVMSLRFSHLFQKRMRNQAEIDLFQKNFLRGGNTIAEAINSGERTFDDFLKILDDAKKFKSWLKNENPDISLMKSYYNEATKGTWVQKLPFKIFRFMFFVGGGWLTDVAMETGLNAADSFLLDRLVKGWRPNQFVEGPLQRFVDGD